MTASDVLAPNGDLSPTLFDVTPEEIAAGTSTARAKIESLIGDSSEGWIKRAEAKYVGNEEAQKHFIYYLAYSLKAQELLETAMRTQNRADGLVEFHIAQADRFTAMAENEKNLAEQEDSTVVGVSGKFPPTGVIPMKIRYNG